MVELEFSWYDKIQGTKLVICPGSTYEYVRIPPLPLPPPLPPDFGKLPPELLKILRDSQRKLIKFTRRWNKFVGKSQKYADKVTRKSGDGQPRHIVLALDPEGLRLALSTAAKPHDHYAVREALGKVPRESLKAIPDPTYKVRKP